MLDTYLFREKLRTERAELTSATWLLGQELLRSAGPRGACVRSLERLAAAIGRSVRTVQRGLASLSFAGFLSWTPAKTTWNRFAVNRYALAVPGQPGRKKKPERLLRLCPAKMSNGSPQGPIRTVAEQLTILGFSSLIPPRPPSPSPAGSG